MIAIRVLMLMIAGQVLAFCDSGPGWEDRRNVDVPTALKSYPALFSVDRAAMGLPPLPSTGIVRILTVDREHWPKNRPLPDYDVWFQFFETPDKHDFHHTERIVTLKKTGGALRWQSEQMTFHGPKTYLDDEEIQEPEMIVIRSEIEWIGANKGKIAGSEVFYVGPDKRLGGKGLSPVNITLGKAGPILREWGYVSWVSGLGAIFPAFAWISP